MTKKYPEKCEDSFADCPVKTVLDRIGDKWSMLTIIMLHNRGTLRFNELHHFIDNISHKMLTVTLKAMEADGLISRKLYPQIPPKVEYSLTPLGKSLVPPLMALYDWAAMNMPEIRASRERYEKATTKN